MYTISILVNLIQCNILINNIRINCLAPRWGVTLGLHCSLIVKPAWKLVDPTQRNKSSFGLNELTP